MQHHNIFGQPGKAFLHNIFTLIPFNVLPLHCINAIPLLPPLLVIWSWQYHVLYVLQIICNHVLASTAV